jgi:hypothetical protein
MLRFRPNQLAMFRRAADAGFLDRLVEHLRKEHGDVPVRLSTARRTTLSQLPEDTLRELARHGVAKARAYGLTWESSITSFVALMFVAAPNFDDLPPVAEMLREPSVYPEHRVEYFVNNADFQTWQMIQFCYDPAAWQPV